MLSDTAPPCTQLAAGGGAADVITTSDGERGGEWLPAASKASTAYEYDLDYACVVSVYVVADDPFVVASVTPFRYAV